VSVIFVALPVALLMGAAAAWACVRCIGSGQFDDLESPPVRVLLDDKPTQKSSNGPPGRVDLIAER
jgi:cbb3-type cytochrome oxidase maturation protein